MKLVLVTLAATALGGVLVSAANNAHGSPLPEKEPPAFAERVPMAPCDAAPGGGHPGPRGPALGGGRAFAPPSPLVLASRLAALETYVGITGEQLSSWRAYTDAFQAMLIPPEPPEAQPDALSQADMLARHAAQRGTLALDLAAAVEELRGKLSPDQLQRLSSAGPLLPMPPLGDRPQRGPLMPIGPDAPEAGRMPPP
ncbi:hypothetical protein MKI84_06680 [Ancylobacter sp. A5.8]|uniref:hypothetical protein n=1 Tax=Ancylobacter gelatini TaxID=2919920 RepID=UPI001F4DF659|nr:hypothetical protein [Ancylobacter gelatini]MCJ8142599.1 hypothetical protein [Ancylobacter gelatini]